MCLSVRDDFFVSHLAAAVCGCHLLAFKTAERRETHECEKTIAKREMMTRRVYGAMSCEKRARCVCGLRAQAHRFLVSLKPLCGKRLRGKHFHRLRHHLDSRSSRFRQVAPMTRRSPLCGPRTAVVATLRVQALQHQARLGP